MSIDSKNDDVKTDYPLITINYETLVTRSYLNTKFIGFAINSMISKQDAFFTMTHITTTSTQEKINEFINRNKDEGLFINDFTYSVSNEIFYCDKINPELLDKMCEVIPVSDLVIKTIEANNLIHFDYLLNKCHNIADYDKIYISICGCQNDQNLEILISFHKKIYKEVNSFKYNVIDPYKLLFQNNNYKMFCYVLKNMLHPDAKKEKINCRQFLYLLSFGKHEFIDKLIEYHEINTNNYYGKECLIEDLEKCITSLDYLMELHRTSKLTLDESFLEVLKDMINEKIDK
jgi:hypothetical protein